MEVYEDNGYLIFLDMTNDCDGYAKNLANDDNVKYLLNKYHFNLRRDEDNARLFVETSFIREDYTLTLDLEILRVRFYLTRLNSTESIDFDSDYNINTIDTLITKFNTINIDNTHVSYEYKEFSQLNLDFYEVEGYEDATQFMIDVFTK